MGGGSSKNELFLGHIENVVATESKEFFDAVIKGEIVEGDTGCNVKFHHSLKDGEGVFNPITHPQ